MICQKLLFGDPLQISKRNLIHQKTWPPGGVAYRNIKAVKIFLCETGQNNLLEMITE